MEEKLLVKSTTEGLFTLTTSGSEIVNAVLNSTHLEHVRRYQFPYLSTDYHQNKKYQKWAKQVEQIVSGAVSILHIPSELSWENIKLAIQTTYKKAIPKVHLFQFLTKKKEYLDVDINVRGMSKLSDYLTQHFVNSIWGMFGYIHPLGIHGH